MIDRKRERIIESKRDDDDDEFDFRQQRQQLKQRASAANRPAAGGPAEEAETEAARINPHTAAICEACRQGDTQQLKQLLAKPGTLSLGCLGQTDAEGNAPLHAAARAGHRRGPSRGGVGRAKRTRCRGAPTR